MNLKTFWLRPCILRSITRVVVRRSEMIRPHTMGIVPCYYSTSLPPPKGRGRGRLRRVLLMGVKLGSLFTFGTTAFLAYLSYAYTLEELAHKNDSLRQIAIAHPHPLFSVVYRAGADLVPGERDENTKFHPDSSSRDGYPYPTNHHGSYSQGDILDFLAGVALAIDVSLGMRAVLERYVKENYKPLPDKLLPDMDPVQHKSRVYTLVLDLDETLVHSDWKDTTRNPKYSLSFVTGKRSWEYEEGWTFKRPGLDAFLEHVFQLGYEVVLYTDESIRDVDDFKYWLKDGVGFHRTLTKGHTKYQDGKRYRDLSRLNRDPSRIVYVSGHALENCLQPENCLVIKPWKKEVDDTALADLLPFLEFIAYNRQYDIRRVLSLFKGKDVATEFYLLFATRCEYQQRGIVGWWRKLTRG